MALPNEQGTLVSSQEVAPACFCESSPKVGAVEFPVLEKDDTGIFREELLDLLDELDVHWLGDVPLLAFGHSPGDGKCTLLGNKTHHEGQAVATHSASIDHQHKGSVGHRRQQRLNGGEEVGLVRDSPIFDPAVESLFRACLLHRVGNSGGEFWKLDLLDHDNSRDQTGKRCQMPSGISLQRQRHPAFRSTRGDLRDPRCGRNRGSERDRECELSTTPR